MPEVRSGYSQCPPDKSATETLPPQRQPHTLHMMSVRIAPDEPMRAPTTVSRGLSSMNPSAHSAHPEYEFSTVIT